MTTPTTLHNPTSLVQFAPAKIPSIHHYFNSLPSSIILEQQTISVLHRCSSAASLTQLHAHIIKTNLLESDPALTAFFLSCANNTHQDNDGISYALSVFSQIQEPSVFLCNNMIRACSASMSTTARHPNKPVLLYLQLLNQDFRPNKFTFPALLKACTSMAVAEYGRALHAQIIVHGVHSDAYICAALIHMYAKCNHLDVSRQLFEKMPQRDVVLWTTMISACCQEKPLDSLRLFHRMQVEGMNPNEVSAVSALTACANTGALETGMWVHAYIAKTGLEMNIKVATALIDMYSKCGSIQLARQVFYKTEEKNVHVWSVMIAGLAMHGLGAEALEVFSNMTKERVKPDALTFIGVLCACSHTGLVEEGIECFNSMKKEHGIIPISEHYGCVVDLFGRQGLLEEAHSFIQEMPIEPNAVMWRSLLASCRVHGNIELGEKAANVLFELEPQYDANYLLLSNLYAMHGRWNDVARVRLMMKERGIDKNPGSSLIEVNGSIHEFVVADKAHPQHDEIYESLGNMVSRLKEVGYIPQTSDVLLHLKELEKEQSLLFHSEKLAVAYGLISTSQRSVIRVVNNIRMCSDCHSVMKLVSKVFDREVIIRDCFRFHHFVNGSCSCKGYW